MDKGILHYGSLVLFGIGLTLSNLLSVLRNTDMFSILMVAGGIGISIAALRPILNGSYKDFEVESNWNYILALGALMMIAGAALQIVNTI